MKQKLLERLKHLTISSAPFAALLTALFASTSAWAALKPVAVWNGDFVDGAERNGFVLSLNNGTATENLNTISADGKTITINKGAGGVTVLQKESGSPTYYSMTGIVGIKTNDVALTQSPVLMSVKSARYNNMVGLYLNSSGVCYGLWGDGDTTRTSSKSYPSGGNLRYFALQFETLNGTAGYVDAVSCFDKNSNIRDGYGNKSYGISIGGLSNGNTRNLTGATVNFIALFAVGTKYDLGENISDWSLTSMTKVGADLDSADSNTGVNLPSSSTLSVASTPAAVFVQQTSTLTVTGSGSLNINSGNGPLYVADGTSLTIDATGLTLNDGDMVTLVSGKIYGTESIAVKVPVVAGCKVTPTITDTAITLTCATDSVSFTSPFTGNTLASPATGTGYANSATQISFGNNANFNQAIGNKTAIVVDIFGGTYEKLNGFLYTAEATAADARTKDVYLTLTGGTANRVSGVQDCTVWSYAGTTTTTGDAIVQIEDGATVDFAYGAGGAGGYSGYQVVVNGSTGVSIKGGTVNGSVVGGWTSSHNLNPTVNYDTAVRVETVMGSATAATGTDIAAGYIIGGSAYNRNNSSASTVGRDASVTLALAGKSGTFGRTIIGGSAQVAGTTTGNQYVTRNSSVAITAANEVTFANPIVGGGAKLVSTGSGAVNVGGNSAVTISGGTYTGRIVAGGYAPNGGTANVAGTATLTLNSGVFSGAILDGGNATGAKTLVVGDSLDIAGATVTGFTAVTLGDGAVAQMTTGEEGSATLGESSTLRLIIKDADIANGYTPSIAGSGTVEYYEYVESVLTKVTDSNRLDGNNLLPSAPVWSPADADGDGDLSDVTRWSTGALPADNAAAVKITVNGSNTLTIDETRTFGRMDVDGTGALVIEGDGTHNLSVGKLVCASDATVTVKDSFSVTTSIAVNDGILVVNPTEAVVSDQWTASDNGTFVVYVGSGDTTTISTAITATKLIKRGEGTLVLENAGNAISQGTVIEAGTIKVNQKDSNNISQVFGQGTVTIAADGNGVGGALDVNNCYVVNQIYLCGNGPSGEGALVNNTDDMGSDKAWTVSLTGNASWGGSKFIHFGASSSIVLDGHTFTKKGSNNFPLNNTTMSGSGTIVVEAGQFQNNNNVNNLSGIDIVIKSGATLNMAGGTSLSVNNCTFEAATATVTANATVANSAKLIVNGTLAVNGTLSLPKLEMASGTGISFASASAAITVGNAITLQNAGTVAISFADGVPDSGTLIDWSANGTAPAGTFALNGSAAETHILTKSATGLSIAKGYASITAGGVTTLYGAVADAVNDAANGQEVKMIADSNEAVTLSDKGIVFDEGDCTFTGSFTGNGTLTLSKLWKNGATARVASGWTGTVVLPEITSAPSDGFRFDYYGNSGSTVEISNGFNAWMSTGATDAFQVKPLLKINSAFTITGNNGSIWYNFREVSGTGTITLRQTNTTNGFHIKNLKGFSGKINNEPTHSGTVTPFTVEKIYLDSAPTAGQLLISTDTPNYVELSTDNNNQNGVYSNNDRQTVIIEKKTDGIYVAATASTETVGEDTVTVLDTGSNSSVNATGISGKVAIPVTVTQITGVSSENLLLKVAYNDGAAQTKYYAIVTLDGSGNVSLNPSATVDSVKVQPETANVAPMSVATDKTGFSVKTIPGLWYSVWSSATVGAEGALGGTIDKPAEPVQATSATTTVDNGAPATGVRYYKIVVGASKASLK